MIKLKVFLMSWWIDFEKPFEHGLHFKSILHQYFFWKVLFIIYLFYIKYKIDFTTGLFEIGLLFPKKQIYFSFNSKV